MADPAGPPGGGSRPQAMLLSSSKRSEISIPNWRHAGKRVVGWLVSWFVGWFVGWVVGGWCAAKMAALHVVATERDPPGVMVGRGVSPSRGRRWNAERGRDGARPRRPARRAGPTIFTARRDASPTGAYAAHRNVIGGNFCCFRCWEIRRLGVSEEILNILQAS